MKGRCDAEPDARTTKSSFGADEVPGFRSSSHFGFRPPGGGTPCVPQACSPGFSRWGTDTSRRVGLFDPKNSSSAERNERSERIRGLYANAATHLPGEWQLPQNFFSFGIFRFFRPSSCRIKFDALPPEGGTTCLWSPGFSRCLVLSAAILRIAEAFAWIFHTRPRLAFGSNLRPKTYARFQSRDERRTIGSIEHTVGRANVPSHRRSRFRGITEWRRFENDGAVCGAKQE